MLRQAALTVRENAKAPRKAAVRAVLNSILGERLVPPVKTACARGGSPAVSFCHGRKSQTRVSQYLFVCRALRQSFREFRADGCSVSAPGQHPRSRTDPAFP